MGNPFKTCVLLAGQSGRLSKSHFSGKKIVSLAQKSFCSNHDIPPSIDSRHMRLCEPEYKHDALARQNMPDRVFFCASPGVPMPR
jgi:hypothetical protein